MPPAKMPLYDNQGNWRNHFSWKETVQLFPPFVTGWVWTASPIDGLECDVRYWNLRSFDISATLFLKLSKQLLAACTMIPKSIRLIGSVAGESGTESDAASFVSEVGGGGIKEADVEANWEVPESTVEHGPAASLGTSAAVWGVSECDGVVETGEFDLNS